MKTWALPEQEKLRIRWTQALKLYTTHVRKHSLMAPFPKGCKRDSYLYKVWNVKTQPMSPNVQTTPHGRRQPWRLFLPERTSWWRLGPAPIPRSWRCTYRVSRTHRQDGRSRRDTKLMSVHVFGTSLNQSINSVISGMTRITHNSGSFQSLAQGPHSRIKLTTYWSMVRQLTHWPTIVWATIKV